MITGVANVLRNFWQIGLFTLSKRAKRNKNQALSNTVSALTNLPQAIGGAITGRVPDALAAGLISLMYGVRAGNYQDMARTEAGRPPTRMRRIAHHFSRRAGMGIGTAIRFAHRHRHKIPGTAMTVRGAIQAFEDPVAGGSYITVGVLMLGADFRSAAAPPSAPPEPSAMLEAKPMEAAALQERERIADRAPA